MSLLVVLIIMTLAGIAPKANALLADNSSMYGFCGQSGNITSGVTTITTAGCSVSSTDNDLATYMQITDGVSSREWVFKEWSMRSVITDPIIPQSTVLLKIKIDWVFGATPKGPTFAPWKIQFLDASKNIIDQFNQTEIVLDGFWGELPRIVHNFSYIRIGMNNGDSNLGLNVYDLNVADGAFTEGTFDILTPDDNVITAYDLKVSAGGKSPTHTFLQFITSNVAYYEFIPPQASKGFVFGTNSTQQGNIEDMSDMIRVFSDRYTVSGWYPLNFNVWFTGSNPDIDPPDSQPFFNLYYDASQVLSPSTGGGSSWGSPTDAPELPTPPQAPDNAWDVGGWLKYITDWIIFVYDIVIYMFRFFGTKIGQLVEGTEGFTLILASFFSFLPPEITALLTLGIVVVILLRIFGR